MTLALTHPSSGQLQDATIESNNLAAIEAAVNGFVSGGRVVNARKSSATTVSNTTTKTDVLNGEITLTAGALSTTGIAILSAWGQYLNNTGSNRTATIELKFGATAIGTLAASATNWTSSANQAGWRVEFNLVNLTSLSSQFSDWTWQGNLLTGTAAGSSAINTASSVAIQLNVTFPIASSNLTMSCYGAILEIVT